MPFPHLARVEGAKGGLPRRQIRISPQPDEATGIVQDMELAITIAPNRSISSR